MIQCTCAYKYLARLLAILEQRPALLLAQLGCSTSEQQVVLPSPLSKHAAREKQVHLLLQGNAELMEVGKRQEIFWVI